MVTKAAATTKKAPAKKVAAKKVAAKKAAPAQQEPKSNRVNSPKISSIGRFGNLGGDPELRFSANGTAVCTVSLAYTPYNFETKEQGETIWYRCIGFNALAEQMSANLETGMRVVVTGRPQLNEWDDDEGEHHVTKEILLDAIGPDLRFANVTVQRITRRTASRPGNQAGIYNDEEPF